jgi:type II secretory pathway pseudopilin PulG
MNYLRKTSGFTVLEFLIVLTIIIILVAIALPALERARVRSYNEKIVTDIKSMALGLEQFKQTCGEYPTQISPDTPCNENNPETTLRQFIPMINDYTFNGGGTGAVADISYFPFRVGNANFCTGFHIGAALRQGNNSANIDTFVGDMDFNSIDRELVLCGDVSFSVGFDGRTPGVFDIVRQ